jgi:hypothetical protein
MFAIALNLITIDKLGYVLWIRISIMLYDCSMPVIDLEVFGSIRTSAARLTAASGDCKK